MDRARHLAKLLLLPLVNPEASSYPLTTDFVLATTKPYRDRLIPFCAIDPRTSFRGGHQGLVDMLHKYMAAGAKGFGESKPGIPIDDPRTTWRSLPLAVKSPYPFCFTSTMRESC